MKSMITILWERSMRKKQVEQRLRESSREEHKPDGSCRFGIEKDGACVKGSFVLGDDTSLAFESAHVSDYGVYIAGNWRFELGVDASSGRCICLTAFMSQLTAKKRALELPDASDGSLIFGSDSMGSGLCDYAGSPDNSVYFDPAEKILCVGDPDALGESVRFCENIFATVSDERLIALYLDLSGLRSAPDSGITLSDCINLV